MPSPKIQQKNLLSRGNEELLIKQDGLLREITKWHSFSNLGEGSDMSTIVLLHISNVSDATMIDSFLVYLKFNDF